MRMKVAVIGTRGFPGIQGGVEVHSENLYPRMQDVEITVYRRKPYLTEQSQRFFPGITYVDLPSTRIKGLEALLHTLLAAIHCIFTRPDVVHVHNMGPGLFAPLLRLAGLRVVMTYHSANYEHAKWNAWQRRLLRLCEHVSLRSSHRVIFVNRFQMQKYDARIQTKSVSIPNGINPCSRTEATDFLSRHGIEPGSYLLAVGRLTPEKGFEHLVSAVQGMPQVKQVVIAGAADHNPAYLSTLRTLDVARKVVFTGFTTGLDLCQLYSHARLYVLPSLAEGFPMVMLEAMSYGLPLAVSDLPATRLVPLDDGCYFPPADEAAMSGVIASRLNQPAVPVVYDLTPYNWPDIARRTRQVYQMAMQRGNEDKK